MIAYLKDAAASIMLSRYIMQNEVANDGSENNQVVADGLVDSYPVL
ncbi:hypothetical protein [Paenibacillus sp. PL91]|nr:hypothetical protein [Paenibacillus sp. PL91]MBC9204635.1 hypothetical protein [Paenibacillus sp. PL91]